MKKFVCIMFALALVLFTLTIPAFAYTADDGAGNQTENGTDPTKQIECENDYFNLTYGNASLEGSIGGDLIGVFTSLKTENLKIGGSMRFFALQASIENTSCRNITTIMGSGSVGEGVTASAVIIYATGVVEFSGSCDNLTIYAPAAIVKGEVKNIARIYADSVSISDSAAVNKITVESENKPVNQKGENALNGVLKDKITFKQVNVWKDALLSMPSAIFYAIIGSVIVQLVFGSSTRAGAELFKAHPFRFAFSGFSFLFTLPLLALGLAVFTSQVSAALMFIYLAFIIAAQLFAGNILGARFFPTMNRFFSGIMATTTLAVLSALPYIGGLFTGIGALIAFGYFSVSVFSRIRSGVPQAPNSEE